jgi:hypothetical protein
MRCGIAFILTVTLGIINLTTQILYLVSGAMDESGSLPADLTFSSLQDPGERFALGILLGSGVYSEVYEATDQQNGKNEHLLYIL